MPAQAYTESHIHSSLQHDHVVPLLISAEDARCVHLVVSWADGGDLRHHLAGLAGCNEKRLRDFVVAPLLRALALLHDRVRLSLHTAPPESATACSNTFCVHKEHMTSA